jgi:hypothetical protein
MLTVRVILFTCKLASNNLACLKRTSPVKKISAFSYLAYLKKRDKLMFTGCDNFKKCTSASKNLACLKKIRPVVKISANIKFRAVLYSIGTF